LENYETGEQISFKPITASRDNRAYPISDNYQLAAEDHLSSLAKLQPVRESGLDDNQLPKIKNAEEQIPIKASKFHQSIASSKT